MVALGTDGSQAGIDMTRGSLASEILTGRSFGEFSGSVFGAVKKMFPPEVLLLFLIPAAEVGEVISKEVTIGAGDDMRTTGDSDPYKDYYYQREIGGELHTKVAFGDPRKKARF